MFRYPTLLEIKLEGYVNKKQTNKKENCCAKMTGGRWDFSIFTFCRVISLLLSFCYFSFDESKVWLLASLYLITGV
jgi:hypothetical protein